MQPLSYKDARSQFECRFMDRRRAHSEAVAGQCRGSCGKFRRYQPSSPRLLAHINSRPPLNHISSPRPKSPKASFPIQYFDWTIRTGSIMQPGLATLHLTRSLGRTHLFWDATECSGRTSSTPLFRVRIIASDLRLRSQAHPRSTFALTYASSSRQGRGPILLAEGELIPGTSEARVLTKVLFRYSWNWTGARVIFTAV